MSKPGDMDLSELGAANIRDLPGSVRETPPTDMERLSQITSEGFARMGGARLELLMIPIDGGEHINLAFASAPHLKEKVILILRKILATLDDGGSPLA